MAKDQRSKPSKQSDINQSQNAGQDIDINAIVAALRAAEDKNVELTDLIARLNRNLRQLEEQNRIIIARLQEDAKKE